MITIRYLGQSGYILTSGDTVLVIDPYLSNSVERAAGRSRSLPIPIRPESLICDAVICTHEHLDHLDPDTVASIQGNCLFISTHRGKEILTRAGKQNTVALSEGETITVGDFEITAVFANHTVEAFGLIIKVCGKTLYFSGDTLYHEKLLTISKHNPDITFICINGRLGNLNVSEALRVAKHIGSKINIPNHYDMFSSNSEDPKLFTEKIDGGLILEINKEYTYQSLNCRVPSK